MWINKWYIYILVNPRCPRIDYEWIHILTYNVFIANVFGRYTTAVTIALVTHWTFHKVKSISASYIKLVLQKLNNQIFELIKYSYVNILYLLPIHLFNCIQDMRVTLNLLAPNCNSHTPDKLNKTCYFKDTLFHDGFIQRSK